MTRPALHERKSELEPATILIKLCVLFGCIALTSELYLLEHCDGTERRGAAAQTYRMYCLKFIEVRFHQGGTAQRSTVVARARG